jgi:hypothetical protein
VIDQQEPPAFHKRVPRPPRRRANIVVGAEQLAALLNLPPDVTVAALALDPLRDAVVFSLAGNRFDEVPAGHDSKRLVAYINTSVSADGTETRRVTWEGLEGAELVTRRGGDTYQFRHATVRARQWLGDNEAEIQELTGSDFFKLDQPVDDDPDATGSLLAGPHNVWELVLDGDWIVRRGDGWERMTDEEFVAEYEPVTA